VVDAVHAKDGRIVV
jgi:N-ethylmaleimide reductase